jgi:hypothetical protein
MSEIRNVFFLSVLFFSLVLSCVFKGLVRKLDERGGLGGQSGTGGGGGD